MKKGIFLAALSLLFGLGASAQNTDIGKFLAGGPDDAEKLMEGYLSPYFNAFGATMTGGWYNTAKPHKLGGFDLTATFNTAIIPDADKTMDIASLGLSSFSLANGEDGITPTIAGDNKAGDQLVYDLGMGSNNPSAFKMPKGTGVKIVPTPMLQLGIGLIKDTEINGRYMPEVSYDGFKMDMWGVGFKHGLKQWLPFIKRVPVLHLSVQYGYTQLNSSLKIEVEPTDIGISTNNDLSSIDWANQDQKLEFVTKSHTANLLISADLPIVCFYGGIGFATTNSELALNGVFPVVDFEESATQTESVVTDASVEEFGTNPISMDVKNSDGSTTKPRLNAGMRFKFGVITLHADYIYANYSVATAGIGISFR